MDFTTRDRSMCVIGLTLLLCQCNRVPHSQASGLAAERGSDDHVISFDEEFRTVERIMKTYGVEFSDIEMFSEPPDLVAGFRIREKTPRGIVATKFLLKDPISILNEKEEIVRGYEDVWKEHIIKDMFAIKAETFLRKHK